MSEQITKEPKAPARPRSSLSVGDRKAVREYSALRAKRAARISSESYAAKRRLLTAGVSVAVTALVLALAAFSVVAWAWVALPGVFLAITLVTSAIAGERTRKQNEQENRRLAELTAILKREASEGEGESSKSADALSASGAGSLTSAQVDQEPARKVDQEPARKLESGTSAGERQVQVRLEAEQSEDLGAPSERASAKLKQAFESKGLVEPESGGADPKVERHQENQDPRLASDNGSQWDYVPLPAPTYSQKPRIRARVVHPDTDIVSVKPLEDVAVPGRPVRVSVASRTTTEQELSALETASNPTFRFDLDAVLDQRRAQ